MIHRHLYLLLEDPMTNLLSFSLYFLFSSCFVLFHHFTCSLIFQVTTLNLEIVRALAKGINMLPNPQVLALHLSFYWCENLKTLLDLCSCLSWSGWYIVMNRFSVGFHCCPTFSLFKLLYFSVPCAFFWHLTYSSSYRGHPLYWNVSISMWLDNFSKKC